MERKFLLKVSGGRLETIHHGQKITAKIGSEDDFEVVNGKICINLPDEKNHVASSYNSDKEVTRFWICQNAKDGCDDAEDKFGYEVSWSVNINPSTHKIESTDCKWIKLFKEDDKKTDTKSSKSVVSVDPDVDDDPMPENWEPSEKDLIFFK